MRLKVLSLAATLVIWPSALAATASQLNAQTIELFNEIEHQYFGRNFNTETLDARAQRLEKIMFGDAQAGDANQRVMNIVGFVLKANIDTPDMPNDTPIDNGDEYPHITSLENLILGQSYISGKLTDRLSRLETKAFGKPADGNDLSARTDALDQYVQQKLHKNPFQLNATTSDGTNNSPSATATSDTPDDMPMDYPHIDSLEKQILGQTYIGQSLADRISRMEVKAYGKASPNPDLSQRTDDLDTYVETVLHKKSFEQSQAASADDSRTNSQQSPQQSSQRKKQIAALVANSLLGMTGLGMLGGFMPGMSPVRRNDDQPIRDNTSDIPTEDPLVNQPTAPPANTRMITKVGWCEMQTFGHTSPNMHLIDRLTQLNQQLNYAPGQTGMDLMDDMDALMGKVIAQKQSAPTM